MLVELEIKNFRSCKHVELRNLDYATALVGPNGCGKTNLMRAVGTLARCSDPDGSFVALLMGIAASGNALQMKAVIDLAGSKYTYELNFEANRARKYPNNGKDPSINEKLSIASQDDGIQKELFSRTGKSLRVADQKGEVLITLGAPAMPSVLALLPESKVAEDVKKVSAFFSNVHYYSFDEPNDFFSHPQMVVVRGAEYDAWKSKPVRSIDRQSLLMTILDAYKCEEAKLQHLKVLLGPSGLNIISDILIRELKIPERGSEDQSEQEETYYLIVFHPCDGSASHQFSELSQGTRRLIHMMSVLALEQSSLLLIEHPEDAIHRALLRKVVAVLHSETDPTQLLITSHSSVVMNHFRPADLRLVSMRDGETQVRALSERELQSAIRYLDETGTLSEYLEGNLLEENCDED